VTVLPLSETFLPDNSARSHPTMLCVRVSTKLVLTNWQKSETVILADIIDPWRVSQGWDAGLKSPWQTLRFANQALRSLYFFPESVD